MHLIVFAAYFIVKAAYVTSSQSILAFIRHPKAKLNGTYQNGSRLESSAAEHFGLVHQRAQPSHSLLSESRQTAQRPLRRKENN